MKRIIAALFIGTVSLFGQTTYDTDSTPTVAEIEALIASAVNGDTVRIASGTHTFTSKIDIDKEVSLIGQGPGLTFIKRSTGGILIEPDADNITIGFMTCVFDVSGVIFIDLNNPTSNLSNFRLTNYVSDQSNGFSGRDIYSTNSSNTYTYDILVDNCVFDWQATSSEPIFIYGANTSWSSAAPFGQRDVFIMEDSTIKGGDGYPDFNAYATAVVRYCTIIGSNKLDWHGTASNFARGCRSAEIYGNVFSNPGSGRAIEVRGGATIIWGNTNTDVSDGLMHLNEYGTFRAVDEAWYADYTGVSNNGGNAEFTGFSSAWITENIKVGKGIDHVAASDGGNYANFSYTSYTVQSKTATSFTLNLAYNGDDTGTMGQYRTPDSRPIEDQIGVGVNQLNGEEPGYIFNNSRPSNVEWTWAPIAADDNAIDFYGSSFDQADIFVPDEDVFEYDASFDGSSGVGIGTKAEMNAITGTTDNVGFWVTDEGTWNSAEAGFDGQLYKWNGSAWVLYYTPYTYPHPLNDGVSSFPPTEPSSLVLTAVIEQQAATPPTLRRINGAARGLLQ